MKNIFMSVLFLVGSFSFAQEAGKAGELLKNEASKTEMESPKAKRAESRNSNNSGFRNQNGNNNGFRGKNPNYQWNQQWIFRSFLRIPEQGMFSVELGDQFISIIPEDSDFLIFSQEEFLFRFTKAGIYYTEPL
jgi:hypothetical protein